MWVQKIINVLLKKHKNNVRIIRTKVLRVCAYM